MPTETQLYDEAIELKEAGKLDEAVGKLEALVAAHPDFALAYAGLSVFYERLGRHEEAVVQARKVCDLEPADPFSFMAMSLICQRAAGFPRPSRRWRRPWNCNGPPAAAISAVRGQCIEVEIYTCHGCISRAGLSESHSHG